MALFNGYDEVPFLGGFDAFDAACIKRESMHEATIFLRVNLPDFGISILTTSYPKIAAVGTHHAKSFYVSF